MSKPSPQMRRRYRLLHDLQNIERRLRLLEARAHLFEKKGMTAEAQLERLKMKPWQAKQTRLQKKYLTEYPKRQPTIKFG